jgi:hypothetical protein
MKLNFVHSLLLILPLIACSPSPDQAPKIAESQRADLAKAKEVAAEAEKSTAEAKQNIDEQTK